MAVVIGGEGENSPEVSVFYELNGAISQRTAIVKVNIVKPSNLPPPLMYYFPDYLAQSA